jgi:hypothetical protein
MGKNQGARRLKAGVLRKVTASEASRGYLFVTVDKKMDAKLKGNGIETLLNGKFIGKKATDSCGRIAISRTLIGNSKGQAVRIEVTDNTLIIKVG